MRRIEKKWCQAWQAAACFRAPDRPTGEKFFNFDSGPFPNGPLHMGHVRTYVLGDMTARYQRLLGKAVLYATEWDAFGLPNELEALKAGVSPREYTAACIRQMREQLQRLGISYDWSRVHATCDPRYYRWTQRLFLLLMDGGFVCRRNTPTLWCPRCQTSVAPMQADDGNCWRCQATVVRRTSPQWFVAVSQLGRRLTEGVDALGQWSDTGKRLLRRSCTTEGHPRHAQGRLPDWHVSRQRSWGTPIPVVHCDRCGIVADHRLPVRLPDDLDWSLGSAALAACEAFVRAKCPQCGVEARRETDTLDGFFDDAWSYLSCVVNLADCGDDGLPTTEMRNWMPVDRFHSGFDTFAYLNLYRFMAAVLFDQGLLACPEPIASYMGHDMVLCDGRKMSKHLGNTVSPDAILNESGADALRVAVLWAAAPRRAIEWNPDILQRAVASLDRVFNLYRVCADAAMPSRRAVGPSHAAPSQAAGSLQNAAAQHFVRVARFIEQYRPNAAIEELDHHFRRLEAFAVHRVQTSRLLAADAAVLHSLLKDSAVALSPFAPHLAEEALAMMGLPPFAALGQWPGTESRAMEY